MARLLVIATFLTLALAVEASAGRFLSSESETQTVPPGNGVQGAQEAERPKCTGSRTAVSGGFETEFRMGDPAAPALHLTTFRRDADAWFLSAINFGSGGGYLTAYAYCAKLDVSISFVAKRATGPLLETSATCPSGRIALSGGLNTDNVRNVPYALSRSSKRTWTAAASNPSANEAGLTAYVVCARDKGVARPRPIRAEAPLEPSGGGATATAVATCPVGTDVLSGGFEAPPADGVLVHMSKRAGKRTWEVQASSQTPATGTLVAFAYCL
jgi:hypothetical protein